MCGLGDQKIQAGIAQVASHVLRKAASRGDDTVAHPDAIRRRHERVDFTRGHVRNRFAPQAIVGQIPIGMIVHRVTSTSCAFWNSRSIH